MPSNAEEKLAKTAALIAAVNLLEAPLMLIDQSVGLAVNIVMNAALIYGLHELGRRRRPGSNALSRVYSMFASQDGAPGVDVDNAIRNVINGGAAVVDELALTQDERRRMQRAHF